MVLRKTQPMPGSEKISGGGCVLTVRSDDAGVFAYLLKTTYHPLFTPEVSIFPATGGGPKDVCVLFSYRHILAEMKDSERVVESTKDINAFLLACESEDIIHIVSNKGDT